jgi:hypothetical protein
MTPGVEKIETISILQGFDAMRAFVEKYWERQEPRPDDIATLLSSLDRNIERDSKPLDIALWGDWLEAALKLDPSRHLLRAALEALWECHKNRLPWPEPWHVGGDESSTVREAFEVMRLFLETYWELGDRHSRDIEALIRELADAAQWPRWLAAVHDAAPRS